MPNTHQTSSRARSLARRLLRANRGTRSYEGRSWRVISREDYNGQVNHATLNRIAKSDGAWLPKDIHLLILLGIKKERKPMKKLSARELRIRRIENAKRVLCTAWQNGEIRDRKIQNAMKELHAAWEGGQ
jgi:hypothetical protein